MYIPRMVEAVFQKREQAYSILALVGPRQAGKTTFLKERMNQQQALYLSFDDPDVRELFGEDVKKFEQQYLSGRVLVVLDEVQYGQNAGRNLKYLADKGTKLWITSSSEVLLGKEVLSHLVGRVSIIKLYPFSFGEFLRAKQQKATTALIKQRLVWEHVTYGGYPKVVLTDDVELKRTLLHDLYETMVLKDVAKTFSLTDLRALEEMSRYLAINIGNIFSYGTAAQILKLSFPTIKKYLEAMEKSYLVKPIVPYFTNKNKEISKQPKMYFIDTGLRQSILNQYPATIDGPRFENYVLSELLKAGFLVKYWRTKGQAEVDFLVEKEQEIIPIECKLSYDQETIERSLRGFIETYQPPRAFIVYYQGLDAQVKVGNCQVIITDIEGLLKSL